MKLLTKNTDYAVRALIHVAANPGRYIPASEIAKKESIPAQFLKRILQILIAEGFLSSKEGITGGVRLRREPGRISVIDIIRLFRGDFQISECMFRGKLCPNRPTCVLRARIQGIEQKITKEFEGISIADLLKDTEILHEKRCRPHR
jgi:Rrf2 family protein